MQFSLSKCHDSEQLKLHNQEHKKAINFDQVMAFSLLQRDQTSLVALPELLLGQW